MKAVLPPRPTRLDVGWSSVPTIDLSNDDKDVVITRIPFSSYFVRKFPEAFSLSAIEWVAKTTSSLREQSMRANGAFVYEGKNQEEANRLVYYEVTIKELASHRSVGDDFGGLVSAGRSAE
jgi:hypothetical protein